MVKVFKWLDILNMEEKHLEWVKMHTMYLQVTVMSVRGVFWL